MTFFPTISPFVELSRSIRLRAFCVSMLSSLEPKAFVFLPVWPREGAEAFFSIEEVLATVLATILPRILTHAMNHCVLPCPHELSTVATYISASTINSVDFPSAAIFGSIWPIVNSMALFLAISEMPLKLCSFLPLLNSMAVLKVFDPLSLVGSEIPMVIDPLAMSHVGVPFTNVYVTIAVREASSASGFVVIPLTLVGSAVGPPLSAKTVSHVPSPLAIVCRARLEGVDGPRTITETCWQGFQLDYLAIEIACEVIFF
mmetsp:Transcript_114712/g.180607  ORF Transcript_114712/g.180607 Transcript_114712/m.180607 type:complete len:259 (-) Transcript_114712:252-1028(-)